MSRLRTLLALALAVTWCSAAWHVDLEAVGLMFVHEHHAHGTAHHHPGHGADDDHHDPVVARNTTKDSQVRVVVTGAWWVTLAGIMAWYLAPLLPRLVDLAAVPRRRPGDPPLARVWQFVQRCAPESAAPPTLG